jgi:formylglycine-generating enzyme required for sulfatase activity
MQSSLFSRHFIAAAAVLILGLAVPVNAMARNFAIVIGIDDYDLRTGPLTDEASAKPAPSKLNLLTAKRDAQRVKDWLVNTGEYDEVDIHLLLSSNTSQNEDQAPSGQNILLKWKTVLDRLDDNDVVFFYFAGHGIELRGRNYLHGSDFYVDRNSGAGDAHLTTNATAHAVEFHKLLELLGERQERYPGIVGIFIIDACRINPLIYANKLPDSQGVGWSGEQMPNSELFIMYSAGTGQAAIDHDLIKDEHNPRVGDIGHSIFSNMLFKEINGKFRMAPLSHLADRVRFSVASRANAPPHERSQMPAAYNQIKAARTITGKIVHQPEDYSPPKGEVLKLKNRLNEGDVLMECDGCPEVQVLPKRTDAFKIGSPSNEDGRSPNEEQFLTAGLPKAIAMGRFHVTNREWDFCVDKGSCRGARSDPKRPETWRQPVTNVTWHEAKAYTDWLTSWLRKEADNNNITYRLPTEVEWEYAARGGKVNDASATTKATAFAFGNTPSADLCRHANGADKSIGVLPNSYQFCSDGVGRGLSQVGRYRAISREFSLYDMAGNAWQWTATCWRQRHADPEPQACTTYAARGGSWRSGWPALRSAARNAFPASHNRATLGFRVVREVE